MTTALAAPKDLAEGANGALALAESVAIVDDDTYKTAGDMQGAMRALKTRMEEFFDPHVKRAHEAWKALTADRKAHIDPLDKSLNLIAGKMGGYKAELERQRREEEAVLRRQAEEEARQAAEETAEYHEFMGDMASADAVRSASENLAGHAARTVVVESYAPKVENEVSRANWKFEIVDAKKIPRDFLMPDEKAIGAMVRSRKGAVEIPGVRIFCEHKVTVRG